MVALVERNGRVRAMAMPKIQAEGIPLVIREMVARDARIMTDESALYKTLHFAYKHESVKNSLKEYVRDDVHPNTVEGFFSILKRGINGVYHHVGKGHVGRYVDEFAFRWDSRKMSDDQRACLAVLGRTASG